MSNFSDYIEMFFSVIIQVYIILNAPTVVAIMLGISKGSTVEERIGASKQICVIGCFLLFLFAIFGKTILNDIFHISTEAFQVAGGLYIFLMSLSMITSKSGDENNIADDGESKKLSSMIITPLATPLLVGPGTMTATLIKNMEYQEKFGIGDKWCSITFYSALIVSMILVYFTFIIGCKFSKLLTPTLLKVIEKLVGILLACIAISSILSGTRVFLNS